MDIKKNIEPKKDKYSFICPHCNIVAIMAHKNNLEFYNSINNTMSRINIRQCVACNEINIWLDEKMVYPKPKFTLPPNEDLSENIKKLYIEASEIVEQSPCGACAILRLALQKMLKELGLYKKDLNTSIGDLIQSEKINKSLLKALEIVRVCGNNAVHEGVILLDDNKEIAKNLFKLINFIAEKLITEEKEINEFYGNLPNNKKRLEQ